MRILVVYKSISGFTKKYADLIAEEITAEKKEISKLRKNDIDKYDILIFGGSLHAVGINGIKKVKKIINKDNSSKIVIYAVGASPMKPEIENEIKNNNLTRTEEQRIPLFYLRGGFNFSKLNIMNKIIMLLFRLKIMLKKKRTKDEIGMLNAFKKPMDTTSKENIKPLVNFIKNKYRI